MNVIHLNKTGINLTVIDKSHNQCCLKCNKDLNFV